MDRKPADQITKDAPQTPHPDVTGGIIHLRVSRWTLAVLASLLVLPWVGIAILTFRLTPKTVSPTQPAPRQEVLSEKTHRGHPGPWGELEITRIVIEPPEAFIEMDFSTPRDIQWFFPGYSSDRLRDFFVKVGLLSNQVEALLATAQLDLATDGLRVRPERDLILGLSPETREQIYRVLATSSENRLQAGPYRFRAEVAEEWFANCGLPESLVNLVKGLSYRRGHMLLFSDLDVVLPMLSNDVDRMHLVKTLARISTVLVKLRIQPESDLEAITQYWDKGGYDKDVRPFLASIPRQPGGFAVGITHLLPPFARQRLYTYPFPSSDPASLRQDCHWTSLNFFNREPDPKFQSLDEVKKELETNYFIVSGKPVFGDVLLLTRQDGTAIHSCVYVADDIVYTKNGPQAYIPWILMELPDVIAAYSETEPVEVRTFRSRRD
jgi:hypothetical protein